MNGASRAEVLARIGRRLVPLEPGHIVDGHMWAADQGSPMLLLEVVAGAPALLVDPDHDVVLNDGAATATALVLALEEARLRGGRAGAYRAQDVAVLDGQPVLRPPSSSARRRSARRPARFLAEVAEVHELPELAAFAERNRRRTPGRLLTEVREDFTAPRRTRGRLRGVLVGALVVASVTTAALDRFALRPREEPGGFAAAELSVPVEPPENRQAWSPDPDVATAPGSPVIRPQTLPNGVFGEETAFAMLAADDCRAGGAPAALRCAPRTWRGSEPRDGEDHVRTSLYLPVHAGERAVVMVDGLVATRTRTLARAYTLSADGIEIDPQVQTRGTPVGGPLRIAQEVPVQVRTVGVVRPFRYDLHATERGEAGELLAAGQGLIHVFPPLGHEVRVEGRARSGARYETSSALIQLDVTLQNQLPVPHVVELAVEPAGIAGPYPQYVELPPGGAGTIGVGLELPVTRDRQVFGVVVRLVNHDAEIPVPILYDAG